MSRTSLKNKFGDLDDKCYVEVDGEELELNVRAKDVRAFMYIGNQSQMEEKHLEKLENTIRRMLERTYLPYYDETKDEVMSDLSQDQVKANKEEQELIEALLSRHFLDLFIGIMDDLGWADKADIDSEKIESVKKNRQQ